MPDEAIGVEIPVALDQFRPDYDWRTLNRAPLIKLSLLESGFMQTGPIAFLRDILETGSSFFVAAHFDLMFFLHQKNRLFLVFEASLGKYEPKKGTQTSSFRDYYADVLIDYRLHTYKRVELHWAAGGGVTLENYILNGISIENYTSQIKTGGTIRLNVSEHIMLSCFLFYRFNPDKLVNDSRLLYGLSAGVRL